LMKSVVGAVRRYLDGRVDNVVINCRVPAGGRMAYELGDVGVFLVSELAPEAERLARAGRSFLTIDEGLVRHPLETGDNQIDLDWHLPSADGEQCFALLTQELVRLGLTEVQPHASLLEVA
jgi:hypothetical protein